MSCKGLSKEDCNKFESCTYVNGMKRKYCRTKKNRKRAKKPRRGSVRFARGDDNDRLRPRK